MAVGPCVRVCLHFSDLDQETCWFLVDFKKIPTVQCMQRMIGRKFYKSEETSFKLTLKGSLLPAWESSFILRDDDQIIVEHEIMAHHSSEYWSKKKKRKKKLMTNSKKFYFSSAKHNSPGCAQRKISKSSIGEDESILAPEPFHNTVSTPDAESEEQKSYKKKKMKLDCVNDLNLDIEELPAPNKKLKISKPSKTEPSNKKKNVMRESKPELIEVVKDRVKVISPRPENLKEEKVNPSDKSDGHLHLKKVKSEIIKVLNKVSVNLDNAIPMETSDTHPNVKDVSNVVNENSREGNKNLTQIGDNEKSLRKNVEPIAKSSVSGLEKSYTVQEESSSCSVQEKVEVYTIEEEDLKNICQSLNDGETLTIDQDKVKVIDVENASNSSWLDCVEVDCSFPEGSRKTDTSAAKETSKGNGNNPRRRRRRRGQRGFACSPFIYAMSQSLDSDADNRSPVSTPVSSQLKYPPSSNSSQKHFHFTSDTEEDEEEEEENISQPTMIGVGQSKTENNFESSKSSLSSEKIVTNGTEDSNSSFVSQGGGGGGEDKTLSSSQKHPPKKSVHFALENIPCVSFDSNQEPVIYKRGQRRSFPTLMRQQQLNTSLESCSSICTSVEDDSNTASVNGCTPKPSKEYNLLPAIVGYPRAGDKIAFKRLEIGDDYTPRLSNFIEAKVISFQEDSKTLTMKVTTPKNNRRKDGKFELIYENDDDIILEQPDDIVESVELSTLQEVKLLK